MQFFLSLSLRQFAIGSRMVLLGSCLSLIVPI
jgi:hypothetical protein